MTWETRRCAAGRNAPVTSSATIPEREVDVEDPAPRGVVDEQPADQRPQHGGHPEQRAEQPLVATAVGRRDHVADDRLGADHQPSTADPLQRAEGDQLAHRLAQARQGGADEKDHDGGLEEPLPAVHVAELAPQRRRGRRRQQIGGHDPRQVRGASEVPNDRRQRRRHDRLVESGEQHPEHQGAEDEPQPTAMQGHRT